MSQLRRLASQKRYRLRRKLENVRFWPRLRSNPFAALHHILFDVELDNFTYPISNTGELAEFVAASVGVPVAEIAGYIGELKNDRALHDELKQLQGRPAHFGRRLGWYALIRATRPALVVEAGVHDGLGATAILAALERNNHGRLIGMDLTSKSGWLVPQRLRVRLEMMVGDIAETNAVV